jgi:glycosyltransferase involved in cell wall biosynthesis
VRAPKISIIICTRDRAADLQMTLQSIAASLIATDVPTELIVVDNGSTDDTREIVRNFRWNGATLRYVLAPKPGKGHAYNAGIAAAQGEILLWTDDDVRVPENWVQSMTLPILDGRADAVAGGIMFPEHIARVLSRPPFASRQGWFASHAYLNADNPEAMIGANMAFHRRVLEKVPQFDVELGPGALGFRDESLFSLQLKAAGFRLISNFGTTVEHHFDLSRASGAGLVKTARAMGRSYAFIFHHWEHKRYSYAHLRLSFAVLRLQLARFCAVIFPRSNQRASDFLLRMEETVGFCREIVAQQKRPKKYALRGLTPLQPADL